MKTSTDPTRPEDIHLSPLAAQVDRQIETRLFAICHAEWRKANVLPNGRIRRIAKPVNYPATVQELLSLRQSLYTGTDPEVIAASLTTGQIQHEYLTLRAA